MAGLRGVADVEDETVFDRVTAVDLAYRNCSLTTCLQCPVKNAKYLLVRH